MISVYEKANRPLPKFSDDDVIDYMVMEAVVSKWVKEQNEFHKEAEKQEWNKDFSNLKKFE